MEDTERTNLVARPPARRSVGATLISYIPPRIKLGLLTTALVSILVIRGLWYNQRILVYPLGFSFLLGYRLGVSKPRVPFKDVELVTKDKVKLRCYLIDRSSQFTSSRGTVILFHGNAMNHGGIIEPHAATFSRAGFDVLTAEYRGYGLSEGIPSESGLRLDARAAFDYIANHPELSKGPIVIYGQSLGGAVAIDIASRNADRISALIIENTFTSIPNLVRQWTCGRILSLLTTQKWRSASKISGMPTSLPILMLSGLHDTVIPPNEMAELWKVAQSRNPKKNTILGRLFSSFGKKDKEEATDKPEKDVFESFYLGGHNDTCVQYGYWDTVTKFLDEVVPHSRDDIPTSDLN